MWQERSELIDDKARLGRQIIELSKRAQQAEADLATSRATARALASNNAELQEQLAKESSAHAKLEQRWIPASSSCTSCLSGLSLMTDRFPPLLGVLPASFSLYWQCLGCCFANAAGNDR